MAEDSQVDFGSMFRQARERRGLSLQQVAAVTKISARVLEALERNDVSKLPGGIFARSFVRSYAREIGLNPDLAIERFIAEFPDESGAEQMPAAKEAEDIEVYESGRRVATTVLQLLGLTIVVIAVVFFVIRMGGSRKPAPPASSAPKESAPIASAPTTPAPPPPAITAASTALNVEQPAAAVPGAATSQQSNAPIEVTITTRLECWLMVKVDKDVVFERILQPGERLAYHAQSSVTLSAGNAGALTWTLNGKAARPLGSVGQVVTTIVTLETLNSFLQ